MTMIGTSMANGLLAAQFQFGFLQLISRSIPEINEAKIEMKPAKPVIDKKNNKRNEKLKEL